MVDINSIGVKIYHLDCQIDSMLEWPDKIRVCANYNCCNIDHT